MYKHFLRRIIFMILPMVVIVTITNFIVDPENIYSDKDSSDIKASVFSSQLRSSPHGIVQKGWNERLAKTMLARSSGEVDCVILGSSHAMQISKVRNTGNIKEQCDSLLNLAVSGGSFEDLLIFSNIILNQFNFPEHVFIAIDPWTLKYNMDARYGAYESNYKAMLSNLGLYNSRDESSYLSKLVLNLFNGEYFYRSLLLLLNRSGGEIGNELVAYPEPFILTKGYKYTVTLPDGSHVHSRSWIEEQKRKNSTIKLGGGGYKIVGRVYKQEVLDLLQKLLNIYARYGIKVSLIMTPYHPNVFMTEVSKPVGHMRVVDKVVRELADQNNLKVYGSFFPNQLGCKKEEFYDFMHATSKCLGRIDFSQ